MTSSSSAESESDAGETGKAGSGKLADRIVRGLLYLTLLTPLVLVGDVYQSSVVPRAVFFRSVVALAVLAVAWRAYRGRLPRIALRSDPVALALLGFLIVYGVASMSGDAPLKSFFGEMVRMWGGITWIHLLVFYLLLRGWMDSRGWRRYLWGAVAVSGVVSILALAGSAGMTGAPGPAAAEGGLLGSRGSLGLYLLVCVGLTAPLWRRAGRWGRVLLAFLVVVDLVALGASSDRGGMLGLVAGGSLALITAALWSSERTIGRWIAATLGVLVLVGGFLLGAARSGKLETVPVLEDVARTGWSGEPFAVRRMAWDAAIRGTLDRPLLGTGPENFGQVWQEQFRPEWSSVIAQLKGDQGVAFEHHLQRAYSAFLRAFAETGLAGGVLFLGIFVGFFLALIRARHRGTLNAWEAAGLVGLGAGYGLALGLWFEEHNAFPLFLAVAAFVVEAGRARGPEEEEQHPPAAGGGLPLTVLLAAVACLSLYHHGRLARSAWWTGEGMQAATWVDRLESYQRAFEVRPYGTQNIASQFAIAVWQAGDTFLQRRDDEEFVETADRAIGEAILQMGEDIARDPSHARLYAQQAGVYYFAGYRVFEDDRFLKRAVARLGRAVELAPNMLIYRHLLASLLVDSGRSEEAITVLDRTLNLHDGWYWTHRLMAGAHLASGDTVAAGRALYEMRRLRGEWGQGEARAVREMILPAIERADREPLADSLRSVMP